MRNIDNHQVAPRATRQLVDRLGLAGSRRTVEEAGKPLAHTAGLQPLLNLGEVFGGKQLSQPVNLSLYRRIVEELLDGKGCAVEQVAFLFGLLIYPL